VAWLERRCIVIDARVHCTDLQQIAARACTTGGGPHFERTCTGGPPPDSKLLEATPAAE
jgi:hypothetical protein